MFIASYFLIAILYLSNIESWVTFWKDKITFSFDNVIVIVFQVLKVIENFWYYLWSNKFSHNIIYRITFELLGIHIDPYFYIWVITLTFEPFYQIPLTELQILLNVVETPGTLFLLITKHLGYEPYWHCCQLEKFFWFSFRYTCFKNYVLTSIYFE